MIIALGNLKNYIEVDTRAHRIVELGGELWAVAHHFIYPFMTPTRIKATSLFSCYHFQSGRMVANTHGKTTEESIEKLKLKLAETDLSQLKESLPPFKLNKYKNKRNATKS